MGTRARRRRIAEVGAEVGVVAKMEEAGVEVEAKRGVEVTLTVGAEVEAEVTHTAVREADHTLIPPTILEAVPDLHHFTHVREVDPTTPPTRQGRGPEQGLPPSCEEEALLVSWTSDGSRVHGNDQCRTTGRPQAHLPPRPRVELQHAHHHQLGPIVDPRRGRTVENRIPPVMISPMLNCVISSNFKCSCSNLVTKETRQFLVHRLTHHWSLAADIQVLN